MPAIPNLETRISNRLRSIFAAFGQVINDFYLEAGIYFVGAFNAALVAWDIYTGLLTSGQPLAYAVAIAIIAFVAVEGLAVYLVGAAAKTNNGLLWFFSVIFAGFFTYAHYQEMDYRSGAIAQYITLAIPFFVVVGYWARTVKVSIETSETSEADEAKAERDRQRAIEDEERRRQWAVEDEDRQFQRQSEADKIAKNHEVRLANIEAKKDNSNGQNGEFLANYGPKLANANQAKKDKIGQRRETILSIINDEKLTQAELAKRLGVSVGTIKTDLKALNGNLIKS
jgi:DNA-binding transcriptional regulator YiaG